MSAQLLTNINRLATETKLSPLSEAQYAILIEGQGPRGIEALSVKVQQAFTDNRAFEDVRAWHAAARMTDALRGLGFPDVTQREAHLVLSMQTSHTVSNAVKALRDGETSARPRLQGWITAARQRRAQERAQRTGSTPPASELPPSRFAELPPPAGGGPPPPGVPISPPRSAPTSSQNNVHAFPAGRPEPRQDSRHDSRPESRPSPPEGDDEPTGAHFAPPDAAPPASAETGARRYDQHPCFGRDVAIQFERSPTQDRSSTTVNFKVAKAKYQGKTCKEGVDWANGIVLMLEPHEVQIVYAVLMGMGPKCRFAGHGRDNQKWFEVEESTGEYAGSIRFTAGHGREDIRKVSIGHTDLKEVMEVFSRTLQDQGRGQSPVFILAEVRRVYDLYAKKTAIQEANRSQQRQSQR